MKFGTCRAKLEGKRGVYCPSDGTCRAKLEGKRGVYCPSDGTQKLPSCTRSWILQAANAVYLTVVLCGIAYASSEQAMLHCSQPSAIDLSVPRNVLYLSRLSLIQRERFQMKSREGEGRVRK